MDSILSPPISSIELIPERDLTVTQDPTNVWLISDSEPENFALYEQWEKGRPFKAKAVYHHPSGVDFYLKNDSDPFGVRDTDTSQPFMDDELALAPERPGQRDKVRAGETIWSFAARHGVEGGQLLRHNEITDPKAVTPGIWLYVPKREKEPRLNIEYRLLKPPHKMHIAHTGGTTKFTFGAVKKWTDVKADLKHYGDGVNVDIYAVAKVPVEGTIAAYYMDKHDVGEYATTGRVAYTRGFNWQHLAEGSTKAELPTITHQEITASAMLEDDRPSIVDEVQPVVTAALEAAAPVKPTITVTGQVTAKDAQEEPQTAPDDYKTTFQYLNVNEEPELYELVSDAVVREMDGAARTVQKRAGDRFPTKGWFTHEGTPYYRVDTSLWYAVPTQFAVSVENQPFNSFTPTLEDKLALGATLTRSERRTVLLAKTAAKYKKGATITMNIIRQLRQK